MNHANRLRQIEANRRPRTSVPPEFTAWKSEITRQMEAATSMEDWAYSSEEMDQILGRPSTGLEPYWKLPYQGPSFPGMETQLVLRALLDRQEFFAIKAHQNAQDLSQPSS